MSGHQRKNAQKPVSSDQKSESNYSTLRCTVRVVPFRHRTVVPSKAVDKSISSGKSKRLWTKRRDVPKLSSDFRRHKSPKKIRPKGSPYAKNVFYEPMGDVPIRDKVKKTIMTKSRKPAKPSIETVELSPNFSAGSPWVSKVFCDASVCTSDTNLTENGSRKLFDTPMTKGLYDSPNNREKQKSSTLKPQKSSPIIVELSPELSIGKSRKDGRIESSQCLCHREYPLAIRLPHGVSSNCSIRHCDMGKLEPKQDGNKAYPKQEARFVAIPRSGKSSQIRMQNPKESLSSNESDPEESPIENDSKKTINRAKFSFDALPSYISRNNNVNFVNAEIQTEANVAKVDEKPDIEKPDNDSWIVLAWMILCTLLYRSELEKPCPNICSFGF
ncbi:hypothetical protein DdX_07989 [Ditylenchus destructor]|uniref:Uncharacterized protein n=1 Tax=Ditylenchus destructor TaxID=166010 RepID=A0AAD4N2Q0_9BILA|nr:hypothetical protein DdX_07989 [Ditylenchus destructor]